MREEMNLKQLHTLARYNKSYSEFKSQVDKYFNGTPETVVDNTKYKVVKNNVVLDNVIGQSEQLKVMFDKHEKETGHFTMCREEIEKYIKNL